MHKSSTARCSCGGFSTGKQADELWPQNYYWCCLVNMFHMLVSAHLDKLKLNLSIKEVSPELCHQYNSAERNNFSSVFECVEQQQLGWAEIRSNNKLTSGVSDLVIMKYNSARYYFDLFSPYNLSSSHLRFYAVRRYLRTSYFIFLSSFDTIITWIHKKIHYLILLLRKAAFKTNMVLC